MNPHILEVKDLRVETDWGDPILRGIDLRLAQGQVLGVVGESGSGKTTLARAILGYWTRGAAQPTGSISIDGESVPFGMPARKARGRLVSYVPQNPGNALNPSTRIEDAIREMQRAHGHGKQVDKLDTVGPLLREVNLPDTKEFRRRFPHQLSGGQQQRLCIAIALACKPPLVVLDEPTTGLDVVTQARVIDWLSRLKATGRVGMVYVTHDLAVVAQIADRIAVMNAGEIVEEGTVAEVLCAPQHPYTQSLINSIPDYANPRSTIAVRDIAQNAAPVISVRGLRAEYRRAMEMAVAVHDVSFDLKHGECLALVGESGSGKTTIARSIAGLHPIAGGEIRLGGQALSGIARQRTVDQRRRIQLIFQNPASSLNPRQSIRTAIARPARFLRGLSRQQAAAEVAELLDLVRLPSKAADRRPGEMSGGELQRVAIARALAAKPEVLVCDEITSALDVSVQAAVLELLRDLRTQLGLSALFITHDFGVVAETADSVIVLQNGRLCEEGATAAVLRDPQHDYTKGLLEHVPSLSTEIPKFAAAGTTIPIAGRQLL